MKKTYKIDVDCANCANKMEEAAKATTGVKDATVNFMTLKMNVEFEEGADAKAVMAAIEEKYGSTGEVCKMDGFSVDYPEWRFNVRISNTEPVVRLNVETRGDKKLLEEKTAEVLAVIRG